MTFDPTQHQSDFQQQRSRELSRQGVEPPLQLPGYEARQFLGAGAYGEVWVAKDRNTGRKVAIKFYTQRGGVDWTLLSREVEKLVFLSADRYVVQLLDVGWDSDPPYYVMEYVEGGSLQQLLDEFGPLPVGEAVEMFREVATGLLRAHGRGVLHCDLKPANILLDQDRRPRLADFGQSRLSHEQTPALGTLFFMAPEQANLKAVPDARWDVYALGSLLYCMLTGAPPHRTEGLLSGIDSTNTLASRLEKYRHAIEHAPPPSAHRQLPGVDRELADIIDRCLHADPERRFPNVQSVLTALRSRDATKDRKPLLLLGLLGPLLCLLVLGMFGVSTYRKSLRESELILKTWALESSRFAAKFVSVAVAQRIDRYFDLVEAQAIDPTLKASLIELQANAELAAMLSRLCDDTLAAEEKAALRDSFIQHPDRQTLQAYVSQLMEAEFMNVASWFVTDAQGVQLAASFLETEDDQATDTSLETSIGKDYSWRTYFHGGKEELDAAKHHRLAPLAMTQLSTVFRSTVTGTWKVAISAPIRASDKTTVGVVALTVELGRLGDEQDFAAGNGRFVTLVDGRDGPSRGVILQHPLFNEILATQGKLPDFRNYRVPLDELTAANAPINEIGLYTDPFASLPEGKAFARNWIAAREEVRLDAASATDGPAETGLVVLIQENYDSAAAPIAELGRKLRRDGLRWMLVMVVGVFYLWYLVTRALRDPNEATRRAGGSSREPSLHSMETLELPERLQELPDELGGR